MKKNNFIAMICVISGFMTFSAGAGSGQTDFATLLSAARSGNTEAMCDVALAYFNGTQTLKDPFKAKCWIKKAYDNGSSRAERIWNDLKLYTYSGTCGGTFDDEILPKYAKGSRYTEPFTRMVFKYIPGGCFTMGCDPGGLRCRKDEKPAHTVCLKGFWIGAFEVTHRQWQQVMGTNTSRFTGALDRPVENVSFEEVQDFIGHLNKRVSGRLYLPSEAQWEYAATARGEHKKFPWPEDTIKPQANCGTCTQGEQIGATLTVGSFLPNDMGLYDMAGNVKEWCRDYYDKNAYATHQKNDPVYVEKESSRVVRGGSFADNLNRLGVRGRDKFIPGMGSDTIGFRLVLIKEE